MSEPSATPTQGDASLLGEAQRRRVEEFLHNLPHAVGPYRILELIGEGGMGVVYKAEQREPVRRVVALKLIKIGMDTRDVVARFESERQALAMMNHPNVARVFDAGASDTGRPYFVMEYVSGESITRFCDRHRLTVRQRLELFEQACEAVQHAHQKAIIHRDLKPSNVLVSIEDGAESARVKVIDFGVAKATSAPLTERTLFTQTGQLLGTPEYMSPEQADGAAQDIDTRSDIYSLGVVLYELLTGALPIDSTTLRSAAYQELQRVVREVDPPRPSTRLSSLGAAAADVAYNRQTELNALQRQLRGELEWIPLKAMRKDRNERYATAADLASDIRNYLHDRPLRAGPPSGAYRVRKFLRRNRAAVAAAGAVVAALLIGMAATTWQAVRATRAERASRAALTELEKQRRRVEAKQQESEAVVQFLTGNVLKGATPERLPEKQVRDAIVRVMLDPAAAAVGSAFADRPLVEASVRDALATCYQAIGRADAGAQHAGIALELRARLLGHDHADTIESMITTALLLSDQGKFPDAERLLTDASKRASASLGDDHLAAVRARVQLGDVFISQGRFAEAETVLRGALDHERRSLNRPDTIMTLVQPLSRAQLLTGRAAESEALLREAYERARREFAIGDSRILAVTNSLAQCLEALGRLDEARPLFVEAIESARGILGDDHQTTLILINNLGSLHKKMRNLHEAERCYREVVTSMRRVLGNGHPGTLTAINNLGTLLMDQRKLDDAEVLMREAWEGRRRALSETHPETLQTLYGVANIVRALKRDAEAEALYAQLYRNCQVSELPPKQAAVFMAEWGPTLVRLKRHADAEAPLREAQRRLIETNQRVSPQMARVLSSLADVCDHTGRTDESSRLRAELEALLASTRPASSPSTTRVAE